MRILSLIIFLDIAAFAILLPPIMFVLINMGASPAYATLILATYSLGQFISGPFWGNLSDRVGRKPVLLLSIGGAIIGFLILIFAETPEMVLLSRAFAGLMAGKTAIAYAAVTDMSSQARRSQSMGVLGAAYGLGFVIGPGIGAWLGGGTPESADLVKPAIASFGFAMAAFIVCLLAFRESLLPKNRRAQADRLGRVAAFQRVSYNPVLLRFCLFILLIASAMAMIEPATPLLIGDRYGWGPRHFGMILVCAGLASAAVQGGLVGILARKMGEVNMVRMALMIIVLGMMMIVWTPSAYGVATGVVIIGIGVALFTTGMSALASMHAGADERGLYMGVLQSMRSLGRAIGPVFAGALYAVWPELPFILAAIIAAIVYFAISRVRTAMCAPAVECKRASQASKPSPPDPELPPN